MDQFNVGKSNEMMFCFALPDYLHPFMTGVGGILGYYLLLISVRGYNFNIISTAQGMLKRTGKKLMSVVWHLARWLE